jgi:hypothetical protein
VIVPTVANCNANGLVAAANTGGYRNQNNWHNKEEDKFISIGIFYVAFYFLCHIHIF